MSVGIGITTRNRPVVLRACLNHFLAFPTPDSIYVIVDDSSNEGYRDDNKEIVQQFTEQCPNTVIFRYSENRLGISNAKNASLFPIQGCDHIFLFDDDSWPQSLGWAESWININAANGVQHSQFNVVDDSLLDLNHGYRNVISKREIIGQGTTSMVDLFNSFGVVLYYTKECIAGIGGFDTSGGNVYGYEHCQHSLRATRGGFTGGRLNLVPSIAHELIYSVDIQYAMLRIPPKLEFPELQSFASSVPPEETANAGLNAGLMSTDKVFIPLVDPLSG